MPNDPTPKISEAVDPLFQAIFDADAAVMELRKRRPDASDSDVTLAAVKAALPAIRSSVLEELKRELLSGAVLDKVAEERAIEELYGHWEDVPSRENKEARQRQRYAQLAKKPGVQESWIAGARLEAERFVAALNSLASEGGER